MRRKTIKGILHNFLGTYTSRYSDYDGYWLFGLLVGNFGELKIDLLSPTVINPMTPPPVRAAIQLAAKKFREQIEKAGYGISSVREARLDIAKLPGLRRGAVNGHLCAGHEFRFVAEVVSDHGKRYESEVSIFVAPHDPAVERRSTRGT